MRPFAGFALWFSGTVLMTGVIWAAVGVYALDSYERTWGPHRMFIVVAAFSFVMALVTLFLSGLGAKLGGMTRHAPVWLPIVLAVLSVIANYFLGLLMYVTGYPPSRAAAVLWILVVPTGIAFVVARRFRAPAGVPPDKSLERTREG